MNLVKTTNNSYINNSYINMDTIESIYGYVRGGTHGIEIIKRVRCISGETYDISEEVYNTILKYGKAKV